MKLEKPIVNLESASDPVLPTQKEMANLIHHLEHSLAVPQTGGLTPNPLIRERIAQSLQQRKIRKYHPLRALVALFTMRIPVYQAAFGMVILLFAFMATERTPSTNNASSNIEQVSTSNPHHTQPGLAIIDSLAQIRASVSDTAFISSAVDSL